MADRDVPLCVDLDGTLLRTDTLVEGLMKLFRQGVVNGFRAVGWLARGRAHFKERVAESASLAADSLPENPPFVAWLLEQHAAGRRLVLCTAANRRIADAVAQRFGFFDEVIASDGQTNLKGRAKVERLVARFGSGHFDYAGDSISDLAVWAHARKAIVVNPSFLLRRRLRRVPRLALEFPGDVPGPGVWLRALRVHQWAKNGLIFLPAVAGQRLLEPEVLVASVIAFLLFGICASGTYLLNDLMDLESDRGHETKRHRPLAKGALPLDGAIALAAVMISGALVLSYLLLGEPFFVTILFYLIATIAYSTSLKRIAMVDVLTLAGLYAVRVIAGGAATGITPTFWLLAFSIFVFLSLAMAKRYTELRGLELSGREQSSGRGYTTHDLPLVLVCGVAAGYMSILVLAFYMNANFPTWEEQPNAVWLICPLMLYWINRIWIRTHRNKMHDDPVVFALKDKPSLITGALVVLLFVAAS